MSIPVYIPVCIHCKYFHLIETDGKKADKVRCKAYPEGIPAEIWRAKATTGKASPCPNGYHFEPRDKAPRSGSESGEK